MTAANNQCEVCLPGNSQCQDCERQMPAGRCGGHQCHQNQSSRNVDCLAVYAVNPAVSDHICITSIHITDK